MKKRVWILVGVLVLTVTIAVAAATPGSEEDPLISKSYLEGPFSDWVRELVSGQSASGGQTAPVFEVQSFSAGETVTFTAGTELILRMGKATVVATDKGGLADVTDGVDLANGTAFPPNHQLIVPVGDGRGFFAQEDLLVMVKGAVLE